MPLHVHYRCWLILQGEVEFRSILYVPAVAPTGKEDIVNPKTKNIRLYVKRVFISDDFDGELVRSMFVDFHKSGICILVAA